MSGQHPDGNAPATLEVYGHVAARYALDMLRDDNTIKEYRKALCDRWKEVKAFEGKAEGKAGARPVGAELFAAVQQEIIRLHDLGCSNDEIHDGVMAMARGGANPTELGGQLREASYLRGTTHFALWPGDVLGWVRTAAPAPDCVDGISHMYSGRDNSDGYYSAEVLKHLQEKCREFEVQGFKFKIGISNDLHERWSNLKGQGFTEVRGLYRCKARAEAASWETSLCRLTAGVNINKANDIPGRGGVPKGQVEWWYLYAAVKPAPDSLVGTLRAEIDALKNRVAKLEAGREAGSTAVVEEEEASDEGEGGD